MTAPRKRPTDLDRKLRQAEAAEETASCALRLAALDYSRRVSDPVRDETNLDATVAALEAAAREFARRAAARAKLAQKNAVPPP